MTGYQRSQPVRLEAKSPFELRVNLGRDVPEMEVRAALANGEMGFLHSFTTDSTVDEPGDGRCAPWRSPASKEDL